MLYIIYFFPAINFCLNDSKFGGGRDDIMFCLGFGLALLKRNRDFINVFGIHSL